MCRCNVSVVRKRVVAKVFANTLIVSAAGVFLVACATTTFVNTKQSLDQVDSLFDKHYYAWFGSMYDRQSGGAYYSAAARSHPNQYPPHIESTGKYVRVLQWSNQIHDTPRQVRSGLVNYVKSRQVGEPQNQYYGFFLDYNYRDLNPANNGATVDRGEAGRALGFSEKILALYDATHDYPLPSSRQNPGALADLKSGAAFRIWLSNRNWNNPYHAGAQVLEQASAIENLSQDKRSELLTAGFKYLKNQQQHSDTGLWGSPSAKPYNKLNGAHKLVSFFRDFNHTVPDAQALLQTTLNTVRNQGLVSNLLYTYNSSQLASDLKAGSGATLTDTQLKAFLSKQAANLSRFKRADGGFSRNTSGRRAKGNRFEPSHPNRPLSNTDAGGLALKARDALNHLALGRYTPIDAAGSPLLFALSGANSQALVTYQFKQKSLAGDTVTQVQAQNFSSKNTIENNGPNNNGFFPQTGTGNDYAIGHQGFNDSRSYYQFTASPTDGSAANLYFLALNARSGCTSAEEKVVLEYALGQNPVDSNFVAAGSTMISRSYKTRDIPLSTLEALQGLDEAVTFRIYGKNFANEGCTFRLNNVQLFGTVPETR